MEQAGGGDDGEMLMLQLPVTESVAGLPELSSTIDVKLKGPEAVGVPVIAPVDAFRVRPPGRFPEMIENV